MTFELTTDYELVRSLLTEPRCYARMRNDEAPNPEELQVGGFAGVRYVIGLDGKVPVAVFMLIGSKSKAVVHFCMSPHKWGDTEPIAIEFLEWAWKNTRLIWLKGPVPSYNRMALRLALAAGFKPEGIEENVGKKNGKLFDLCWLAIERPREYA